MAKKKVEDEKEAHALLSASGASRWMECTPSARLEDQFEDTESEYAKEGTLAHELAELKLRKFFIETGMAKRTYTSRLNKLKKNELWQDEMDGYTEVYTDYIKQIAYSLKVTPFVVIEKQVSFEPYCPEGFGTADCIMLSGNTLYVIDLKYGKGVPVYAENNPQIMLYGLGAYKTYSILYNITDIKMAIVQPRLDNITEFSITPAELLEWAENTVKPEAVKAFNGEGEYSAGKHCQFCKAGMQCRARAENNLKLLDLKKDTPLLTDEEIGQVLEAGEDIVNWYNKVKTYALEKVLKGGLIPGWKAVKGKKERYFDDIDEAFGILSDNGIAKELLYEKKQLTLAQAENVVGKKQFNELVGNLVKYSKGKPTLAKESDPREPYTNVINASDEFDEYVENN